MTGLFYTVEVRLWLVFAIPPIGSKGKKKHTPQSPSNGQGWGKIDHAPDRRVLHKNDV